MEKNDVLIARPELENEWDFKKNDELGFNIYKMTKGNNKKAWWSCPKCKSSYDMQINSRSSGGNCPYCAGRRVNHTNSLAVLRPDLASEWHPVLNGKLTPHDVTCNRKVRVWWLGWCGHEWNSYLYSRSVGHGCPYCSNSQVLKGFNDMWTTNPELAKQLLHPTDGLLYTQSSGIKLDWICNCNNVIRGKSPSTVDYYGVACPICSDGVSYPQKLFAELLFKEKIDFQTEKTFEWSDGKRYDFYLAEYNMIVETHGKQHFEKGFETLGGNTLEEVQNNDKYKERIAKENSIDRYVIIDCRLSDIDYISKNVETSGLLELLKIQNPDWRFLDAKSRKSKVLEVCEIYSNYNYSIPEIAVITKLDTQLIYKYLNQGSKAGLCNYDVNSTKQKKLSNKHRGKIILQFSIDGDFIKEWESLASIVREVEYINSETYMRKHLKGKTKQAYGYIWKHKNTEESVNI